MRTAQKHKQKGFTLIELLIVIAIIGLLSSILAAALSNARKSARDTQRQANVKQLMAALELYYNDNNAYPLSGGASSPNNGWSSSADSSWATLYTALSPYMQKMPTDPLNNGPAWSVYGNTNYNLSYYSIGCNQQWYMIVYRVEDFNLPTHNGVSPGVWRQCNGVAGNSFQYPFNPSTVFPPVPAQAFGLITIGQNTP